MAFGKDWLSDSRSNRRKLSEMAGSVAIIVINWNSYEVTSECLNSLRSVNYDSFEIILVDNGSEDTSGQRLKIEYPEITLLTNESNQGFTGGNNTGIRYALSNGFDYLMLLNNDTITTPNFLKVLISKLSVSSRIGAIQPKIMFNQERHVIWSAGGVLNRFLLLTSTMGENELDKGQFDQDRNPDWITGCCFLVRSDIVRQVGLLDNKLFIYYEDFDWSMKIRAAGFQLLYEPKSVIYHEVGMSNQNRKDHNEGTISPFSHYVNIRNHLFMVRRYTQGINWFGAWTYQLVKFFGYILYFLSRRRFKKLKFTFRGFRDGLLN